MARTSSRRRIEPSDECEQLKLLCLWSEHRNYELPPAGLVRLSSLRKRTKQTGAASERTLQRKRRCCGAEGMERLFGAGRVGIRRLRLRCVRLSVDLKAESVPPWCRENGHAPVRQRQVMLSDLS